MKDLSTCIDSKILMSSIAYTPTSLSNFQTQCFVLLNFDSIDLNKKSVATFSNPGDILCTSDSRERKGRFAPSGDDQRSDLGQCHLESGRQI